jgi:hypothetical protein
MPFGTNGMRPGHTPRIGIAAVGVRNQPGLPPSLSLWRARSMGVRQVQVQPSVTGKKLWGAAAIGAAIGLSPRQAFHRLEQGQIPCAKKIGRSWVCDAAALDRLFADEAPADCAVVA